MSFGKWEVNVSFNSMPQPVATAMAKLNDRSEERRVGKEC